MRAIAYTRVSTKEQVEGYSLTYQEDLCKEYCDKQGWEIVKVFQEQGESAKTADRTQLTKLLEYCRENKGKVDILLVHKLDRLARASADHHGIRALLSRYGMILRSVSENIDETSNGRFMENIYAAVAQLDNDVRAERTKEGLKERVRQGLWAWGSPMGYKNTPSGLIIDKEKAPFIQKAFELFSQGNYTVKDITNKLNKWGLRTKGNKKVPPQAVVKIFQNKLYIGILEVKKWGMEAEGLHQKLITPELFYKVQSIREGRSFHAVPRLVNNPDFPLKNIALCKGCSAYLTGSWSKGSTKRYGYYHCTKCTKTRIPKTLFEALFFKTLQGIQPNQSVQKLFTAVLIDVWRNKQLEANSGLEKVDRDLVKLKNLKSKLVQKNLEGVISDDDYREQVEILNSEITVKEIERSEFREEETNIDYLVSLSENLLANVSTVWLDASFEHKLRFQSLLFPKGIFYEDKNIGTAELGLPFALIQQFQTSKTSLAPQEGIEPPTLTLEPSCSVR